MSWKRIRPLAVGVARRNGDVFVEELYDTTAGERFYRPVGGGIEYGEASTDALRREFNEELDVEIDLVDYLGTIENVFTYEGTSGHEVAIVHEIALPPAFAGALPVEGKEDDGTTYTADWQTLSTIATENVPLYPDGMLALLTEDETHVPPST